MSNYQWKAQVRQDAGKGASRRLRRQGLIPGIIYGADKPATPIAFEERALMHDLSLHEDVFNTRILVDVDGTQEEVVIKDLQRHPYENRVLHIDLQRLDENRYLTKRVPLKFIGQDKAPGVKMGAVMTFFSVDVEVRCYPKDLPEVIEVDVSHMEPNTSIRYSDLKLPEGVQITALLHGSANYDQAVVGVGKPRSR